MGFVGRMAERAGFEPAVRLPVRRLSKPVHSTTLPPLRRGAPGLYPRIALPPPEAHPPSGTAPEPCDRHPSVVTWSSNVTPGESVSTPREPRSRRSVVPYTPRSRRSDCRRRRGHVSSRRLGFRRRVSPDGVRSHFTLGSLWRRRPRVLRCSRCSERRRTGPGSGADRRARRRRRSPHAAARSGVTRTDRSAAVDAARSGRAPGSCSGPGPRRPQ